MSRVLQKDAFPDCSLSKIRRATSLIGSGAGVSSTKSAIGAPEKFTETAIAFIKNTIETAVTLSTDAHCPSSFSIDSRAAKGSFAVNAKSAVAPISSGINKNPGCPDSNSRL